VARIEKRKGYCTLCVSRCGTINTIDDDTLLEVAPDTTHPTGSAICAKGRAAPELVHSPARLHFPLRRTSPKTFEITRQSTELNRWPLASLRQAVLLLAIALI